MNREATPERLSGMEEGHVRFKSAADLEGRSESEEEADGAPHKRAKTGTALNDSAPKWSNPDVYTALPCPETLGAPKKDIVKEIRKAKLEAASTRNSSSAVAQNDDFISFGDEPEEQPAKKVKITSSHDENVYANDQHHVQQRPPASSSFISIKSHTVPSQPVNALQAGPPPPPDNLAIPTKAELAAMSKGLRKPDIGTQARPFDLTMSDPHVPVAHHSKETERSRKRKVRDHRGYGDILEEWEAQAGQPTTPWCVTDHDATLRTGMR